MEVFDSLKVEMDRRNIKLVLAVTPRNPAYAETEGFGVFGPSREVARAVINRFVEKGYVVFDENKDGKHDYTPKMAYNNTHLSYIGAEQFTSRLDSLLKTLK
jgi:hypothetical protein